MTKLFTLFASTLLGVISFGQTTVYETGNGTSDGWTGWSTPVTSNCSGSINGVNHYQFTGTTGNSYSLETYRQFNINSNDIDIYLDVLTQDATIEIDYSQDNVSYTNIFSQSVGAGYAITNFILPTYDPVVSSFYLKVKVSGVFGSPSSTNLYSMKINAVLNSSGTEEFEIGSDVLFKNGMFQYFTSTTDYQINIFDQAGRLITSEKNLKEFDFSGLENGVYFVTLQNSKGDRKTLKVVHSN